MYRRKLAMLSSRTPPGSDFGVLKQDLDWRVCLALPAPELRVRCGVVQPKNKRDNCEYGTQEQKKSSPSEYYVPA
jgi:hypothetical protein